MVNHGKETAEAAGRVWNRLLELMIQQGDAQAGALRQGVAPGLIEEAQSITGLVWPPAVKALLALSDGGLKLPKGYQLMGLQQILLDPSHALRGLIDDDSPDEEGAFHDPTAPLRNVYMHDQLLPIAYGGIWNHLYADLSPGPGGQRGQLVEVVHGEGMRLKASGLVGYLTAYVAAMERGDLVFDSATQCWLFTGGVDDVEDLS